MNDVDFVLVKKRLQSATGIDLDAYKAPQVRRRLDGYLARLHIETWADFSHYLTTQPDAIYQLRDFLAINVSSFFRDAGKWKELRDRVLPMIVRPGYTLQAWSAACSHGAEAYSLAMLLEDMVGSARYRVVGTDIDRSALEQARAGGPYRLDEVKDVPADLQTRHFRQEPTGYWVQPLLRTRARFTEADLLQPSALGAYDLVLCRNVLIYFTEDAKRQVLTNLARALRPGGVLFIGATESIPHEQTLGLARSGLSFYRKAA